MKRLLYWTVLLTLIALNAAACSPRNQSHQVMGQATQVLLRAPIPEWEEYVNKTDGYSIEIPGAWALDASKEGAVARIAAPDKLAIISVYAQPLKNIKASDYLAYSNRHIIKQEQGVKVLEQNRKPVKDTQAYRISWQRPKIPNLSGDLNLYKEIDLISSRMVYTFILKSDSQHLAQYSPVLDHIVESFKTVPAQPAAAPPPALATPQEITLTGEKISLFIPGNQIMFGIFNPMFQSSARSDSLNAFKKYEDSLGYKFEFIMTYIDFWQEFPQEAVNRAYADGRVMMLTWHPVMKPDLDPNSVIIPDIINGAYDPYIKDWANRMKALGAPVFLRFANEMNGDWDPWCAWFFSKDADLYVEAWKHIYQIIKQEGADNVLFVWNPHDRTYPNFKWNNPEVYYPGADYVDWVGLTCYNNGTSYPDGVWRNFNDMYRPIYDEYMQKYSDKPFMITEYSCSEDGGNKKAWIQECLSSLKNYPNIRIAVWFDQTDGKWLYRIDSTAAAKEAFKQGISDPYYLRNAVTFYQ